MRSIAMINQKGGVGKTTTTVNVAAGLARWGSRVLLVDLDPQAHASMHLGIEPDPDQPGIHDILLSGTSVDETLRAVTEKLTVIPSHVDLVAAEPELAQRPDRELILARALEPYQDRFDFIIIDCPPSLGTLTINALAAVREVIIPLQPHFLALQGLGMLLETATVVRGVLNPDLCVSGVALCMYERGTRLAQEVENDVREFIAGATPEDIWHGARVFDTMIRRNIKLAECPSFGQTIFDYAPSSNGAEDYSGLAREFLEMRPAAGQLAEQADQQVVEPESKMEPGAGAIAVVDEATVENVVDRAAQIIQQAQARVEAVLPPGREDPTEPLASPTDSEAVADTSPESVSP